MAFVSNLSLRLRPSSKSHGLSAWWGRPLLLCALSATLACQAQEPNAGRASTQEEISLLQHLTYLRVMQDECPFSKELADDFGFISMAIGMQMASVSKSDMDSLMVKAQARADKEIAASRDDACRRAEEAVGVLGNALGTALQSGK